MNSIKPYLNAFLLLCSIKPDLLHLTLSIHCCQACLGLYSPHTNGSTHCPLVRYPSNILCIILTYNTLLYAASFSFTIQHAKFRFLYTCKIKASYHEGKSFFFRFCSTCKVKPFSLLPYLPVHIGKYSIFIICSNTGCEYLNGQLTND